MLIRIPGIQPRRTQITEMAITFETNHMITSMRFLCAGGAGRTWGGVFLEVFEAGFVFFGEFARGGLWNADCEFAMPALVAAGAEGEGAVFADGEEVFAACE